MCHSTSMRMIKNTSIIFVQVYNTYANTLNRGSQFLFSYYLIITDRIQKH